MYDLEHGNNVTDILLLGVLTFGTVAVHCHYGSIYSVKFTKQR
jgi:hypothetical protein